MFKKFIIVNTLFFFTLLLGLPSVLAADEMIGTTLPFILMNKNFAFQERTDALIIDAGKEVDGASLSISDFDAHVIATRIVDPSYVDYDGPREVIDVYTSEVNDVGTPSDTGRYIIIDFHDNTFGDGGGTNDEGYTFDSVYTITFKGAGIDYVDGSSIVPDEFTQTGVISPVLDKFKYASYDGLDYSYFNNEDSEGPLPLVVFFHGGGQGNDIYTPIRFSNGGTVWANPENQAKYPSHVLAPRNATTPEAMHKVKGIIDEMIADGKVDPNRVYITGFSMGGGSTWTFLQTYPDFAAVAAPLCPAGGPGSVENASAVAHLPLWTFVDEGDFLYDSVVNNDKIYGPYLNDSLLTILPENRLDDPPYNGHVFDGHAVWLPVYNEYVHPERGMLIDWLFSKSKIRGISDVEVITGSGVAPILPETVSVDVNHSSTGVISEERAIVWDDIDPQNYGNDGPKVFEVEGTIEDAVEKVVATVTVIRTIDDIKSLVAQLDEEGEFEGDRSARTLTLHLTAVDLYEKQGATEKAIKHMESFKLLIDQQKQNNLISEKAYNVLIAGADYVVIPPSYDGPISFDVLRTADNPGYYFSGALIDLGVTLTADAVDKDTFYAKARVTEYNGSVQDSFGNFAWDPEKESYALGDGWARWNIVDAYVSDKDGNRVDEGNYVKFDIEWKTRTEPSGASDASRYDVPATRAAWYTGGSAGNLTAYANIELEITQEKEIPGIGSATYVQGETKHDPIFDKFKITDAPGGGTYALYSPENANKDNKRPILVWFHGTGERYHGANPGGNLVGNRALSFADKEFQEALEDAYILVPQSTTAGWGANRLNDMEEVINKIVAENYVDTDRIYVGGLSMGTAMTTPLITSTTENKIDFAAAILSSAGNISAAQADIIAGRDIPVYLVGNTSDGAASNLPVSFENLNTAGVDAKMKLYPAGPVFDGEYYYGAHDSWNYIYKNLVEDENGETIFQWLAKQGR